MEQILKYITYGSFIAVVICMLLNIIPVKRKGKSSILLTRGVHAFGVLATIFNGIRMLFIDQGTLAFASAVVLISVLMSWKRIEKEHRAPAETAEKSE